MAARTRYRRNENLTTIRPNYPGNKMIGNEFCNGETLYEPQFSTLIRWQLSENPQKAEKKADTWAPEVADCTAFLKSTLDGLVWLGHATFLLRINGTTLLFDPILFSSLGLRHRHALPCRPEDLTGIDYLLLSHGHRDHLDETSIKLLARQNPQLQVLAPLDMAKLVKGMASGLAVQEAGWWQQFDLEGKSALEITYLPAAHWHRRGLTDMNVVLWGSFMLRVADKLLYFCGDSAFGGHFEEIEKHFGPVDVCVMPIGAYKPAFMMHESHMDPHEAAKAANILRAGHVVPMHYGTFDLSDEPASEPLRTLQEVANGQMLRGELHAPAVGEVMSWQDWE